MGLDMIELIELPFIQRALLAAVIAGFLLSLIGSYIVPKKLSLIGDASSHVAFSAIGLTALMGLETGLLIYLVPATAIYVILVMINRFKISGDQALAILLALGAAMASLTISLGARISLHSVLFGSILLVSVEDVLAGTVLAAISAVFVSLNFGKTILYTLNEELARIRGVKVGLYQFFFAVTAGLSIVTGIKVAGVLLVTALVAIPTTAASLISNSFRKSIMIAVLFGIASTTTSIIVSYYLGITPGAAAVFVLMGILAASSLLWKLKVRI